MPENVTEGDLGVIGRKSAVLGGARAWAFPIKQLFSLSKQHIPKNSCFIKTDIYWDINYDIVPQ